MADENLRFGALRRSFKKLVLDEAWTYDQLLTFAANLVVENKEWIRGVANRDDILKSYEQMAKKSDSIINEYLPYAKKYKTLQHLLPKLIEVLNANAAVSERINLASRGANAKHKFTNHAKQFIVREWLLYKLEYRNNKSEFARSYVAIVANQFTDANGDPLKITEKTIKEVWLKNPPVYGQIGLAAGRQVMTK